MLGLADTYVAEQRFAANYGGRADAEFVRAALRAYAEFVRAALRAYAERNL